MTLPNVTVNELTVLLGNSINGTDLLSFSDDDGDVIEQFRVRDNNPNSDSSFLIHNGVVLTANVDHTFDAATLNQLVLNSGTSIQGNEYQFQAFSNGEWGPVNTQLISSVVQNVNRPVVVASDISVVQSESVNLADFITAFDPDGFPIRRYRIFDANPGATSGRIVVDGIGTLTPGEWHFLFPEQLETARFIAGDAAPNNDPIFIRAFDRNDGQGADGFGLWSDPVRINAFTTPNFSRPVGVPTETNLGTEQRVAITELFGFTDADNNTLKSVRFFDTSPHSFSGTILENGVPIPAGEFVEFSAADLANVEFLTAERSFTEQIRFQVFDGNHFSPIETFRVRTDETPELGFTTTQSVHQQLELIDISDLVVKLDDGPAYTRYQIFDANTEITSGGFRLGATDLAAGQIHDISTEDFFDLDFRTGVFETRSSDDIYIRAFNGTFWSDWTRQNVRTEPEYIDSLAIGSWLNFRPSSPGQPLQLTFSFMQTFPSYGGSDEAEFISAWPELRQFVRQNFADVEQFANIEFTEVADSVNGEFGQGGDFRIGTYCEPSAVAAFAFFPSADGLGGDIWLNRYNVGNSAEFFTGASDPPCGHPEDDGTIPPGFFIPSDAFDRGSTNNFIFNHELGHALGLKHPFDGTPVLPVVTNSNDFSVLAGSGANGSGGAPSTPIDPYGHQLYDIATLQQIYGANNNHASGDNVYDSNFYNGSTLEVSHTIWDTGGIDTIDTSDQFSASNIDLRPGEFSRVGQNGLLAIAFGTDIENAIGTQLGDTLIGNELSNNLIGGAGNDILEGFGGDDILTGGANNDTFIYKQFDGDDIINEGLGAGRDRIELGLFLGLDDFATDVRLTRNNFDLVIDFTLDEDLSRGSITIQQQGFGANRIETLDFLGTEVDLDYAFNQITQPGQQFEIDFDNPQRFGFGVTAVNT